MMPARNGKRVSSDFQCKGRNSCGAGLRSQRVFFWQRERFRPRVTATVTAVSDYDFRWRQPVRYGSKPAKAVSTGRTTAGFYAGLWASGPLDFGPGSDHQRGDRSLLRHQRRSGGGIRLVRRASCTTTTGPTVTTSTIPKSLSAEEVPIIQREAMVHERLQATLAPTRGISKAISTMTCPQHSIHAHLGYNYGDYWDDRANGLDEHIDWSIGVGLATFGNFTHVVEVGRQRNGLRETRTMRSTAKAA